MTEDDTFRKLKQIPWKEAVVLMFETIMPLDDALGYDKQIPSIIKYKTELAESLGWRFDDFISIRNKGTLYYNETAMKTYTER